MQVLKAGNYVMKVFTKEGNEQIIAFVKQFYVLDTQLGIDIKIKEASNLNDKWTSHELDIQIVSKISIENPSKILKLFCKEMEDLII